MLNLYFFITAILCSVGHLLLTDVAFWISLLVFPCVFVGLEVLFVLFLGILYLLSNDKDPKRPDRFAYFIARVGTNWLMTFVGVHTKVIGKEKLPDEPAVYVANHLSDYDPMVVLAMRRKRRILYLSKPENFHIPLAGRCVRKAGYMPISRDNPLDAARTLKKAAEVLKNEQVDIGIYPEGRRGFTGTLGEFKEGSFLLAKKAEAPLVVTALRHTDDVKNNFLRRPTFVTITVVGVIDKETVKKTRMSDLAAMTYEMIAKELGTVPTTKEQEEELDRMHKKKTKEEE